ncbi:ComF family protein [Pseudomonas frederiksbergensis]|uniref:ComF family protein n=1 Tax=Pseudomonas frederiksbergensis TaxID=104087 RepID=UPI003D1C404E
MENALKVCLKQISGPWDQGWVLDKHMISSTFLGDDERGNPRFDNLRTEVGQATYQLKYQKDWSQVRPLAQAVATNVLPKLAQVGFVVPMPASKVRARQPVTEVAVELGRIIGRPVFSDLLRKTATGQSLKDLHSKAEKVAAIGASFSVNDEITKAGCWNVLIVDDLFDSGASMDAACAVLRKYPKVGNIYVTALTWK